MGAAALFPVLLREEFFPHRLPFGRSPLARWRQCALGRQESLAAVTRVAVAKPADFRQQHEGDSRAIQK